MGAFQWFISLLAIHQIKLFIENDDVETTHNTIKAFYTLNFLVSLFFFLLLLFYPKALTYWGHPSSVSFQSTSAGDTILGISFDTSVVNATLNCLGLIYFVYKRDHLFSIICLFIIAICTSNVTFIFIMLTLALMFLTVKKKNIRVNVLAYGLLLLIAYFAISPANREYVRTYFVQLYIKNKNPELVTTNTDSLVVNKTDSITLKSHPTNASGKVPDSVYKFDNKKLGSAISHLITWKSENDTSKIPQLNLTDADYRSKPGKFISFLQTYNYIKSSPLHFIFGAGIGRFSSKLAFRASGVKTIGSYPEKFKYISPEFEKNHLRTFLFYNNSDASQHSVLNYPYSIYNQITGEYGFIGVLLFIVFYIGYFIRYIRDISYGKYFIFILLCFSFMEYWFETYSLIILFELFMLLNIKEQLLNKREQ
jgi:hypothetical protein